MSPQDQNPPLLELRGIHKSVRPDAFKPTQQILRGISAQFVRGHCTGILGHNGAGKTTTLKVILGLVKADAGEVLYQGKVLTSSGRRHIGYMPEVNKLAQNVTPREALALQLSLMRPKGSETGKKRVELIEKKLAQVGLTKHSDKKIRHLSKGQGRRIAWALATIHSPDLLILDEPFSGLDPLGRKDMYDWIRAERDRQRSILLCTHELNQVHSLCDHFHVFNDGRIVLSTNAPDEEGLASTQMPAWHHSYNLHVSGVDEDQLRDLFKSNGLPPWQGYRQDGYLAVMGFSEYEHACQWFTTMTQQGIVVARFGDQAYYGEEELMPYFKTKGDQ